MDYPNLLMEKWEYEEHVRWLQSLYGKRTESEPTNSQSHLADRLLFALGSGLVLLGKRMQSRHSLHPAVPRMN